MITYMTGNMFQSGADCLVNTVNCEGYMGKGIAYQFKMKFPENNKSYVKACRLGQLSVGKIHFFKEDGITIINFPTKDKWREKSKIEYIEDGMDAFLSILDKLQVQKIAIPPLGCGNGGLLWSDVKKIIEEKIMPFKDRYEFLIFEPSRISYKVAPKQPPKMNVSGLVLLDIRQNLEKFNSLRLQKTGYFVNYFSGQNYFKFDKAQYGPYSHAIDIVAKQIKEYQLYYHFQNSADTFAQIYQTICSDSVEKKYNILHEAVKKATEYVNRIKTDKDLEGIATVLYLVQSKEPTTRDGLIQNFNDWSEDKASRFSNDSIGKYVDYLETTGIIIKNIIGQYSTVL